MCTISEKKIKNNLRTLSGCFLTKHPVNEKMISQNPEINVLICVCLLYHKHVVISPLHVMFSVHC